MLIFNCYRFIPAYFIQLSFILFHIIVPRAHVRIRRDIELRWHPVHTESSNRSCEIFNCEFQNSYVCLVVLFLYVTSSLVLFIHARNNCINLGFETFNLQYSTFHNIGSIFFSSMAYIVVQNYYGHFFLNRCNAPCQGSCDI